MGDCSEDGDRLVIALSGPIGSGKAALAAALAERLGADTVSFGAEVRRLAGEGGEDPGDAAVLQRIGQAMVVQGCGPFVDAVLAQAQGTRLQPLLVVGVRHVEVLDELRRRFPAGLRLVHLTMPDEARERVLMARENVSRRIVACLDADVSELQNARILPQYASVTVSGSLPVELQVSWVVWSLRLEHLADRRGVAVPVGTDVTGAVGDGGAAR